MMLPTVATAMCISVFTAVSFIIAFHPKYAEIGALRYCGGQVYGPVPIANDAIPTGTLPLQQITAFVEGNDGELYGLTAGARVARLATQ